MVLIWLLLCLLATLRRTDGWTLREVKTFHRMLCLNCCTVECYEAIWTPTRWVLGGYWCFEEGGRHSQTAVATHPEEDGFGGDRSHRNSMGQLRHRQFAIIIRAYIWQFFRGQCLHISQKICCKFTLWIYIFLPACSSRFGGTPRKKNWWYYFHCQNLPCALRFR